MNLAESVVCCKCPKCREGNLFTYPNHYNIPKLFKMPPKCPNCGQDFYIEPGFYLGAMWVSTPILLLADVAFLAIFVLKYDMNAFVAFLIASAIMLALLPPIIRITRSAFIHLNVSYEKK
ncbi:MAG TPA: DUF983 domain-containing protein [Chitinophagales bacterium]